MNGTNHAHQEVRLTGSHALPCRQANRSADAQRVWADGVKAGVFTHAMQRPGHLVKGLTARPWWDKTAFRFTKHLEVLRVACCVLRVA